MSIVSQEVQGEPGRDGRLWLLTLGKLLDTGVDAVVKLVLGVLFRLKLGSVVVVLYFTVVLVMSSLSLSLSLLTCGVSLVFMVMPVVIL